MFGDKRYHELIKTLDRPDRTIYVNLKKLQERGLISKKGRGLYGITEKGINFMKSAAEAEFRTEPESLENEVKRRLHAHGSALDLQKPRRTIDIIASAGLLVFKDLGTAFLKLGKLEREYLELLSRLYIRSVRRFLGENKLNFTAIRAAWQNVGRGAWCRSIVKEGLVFDYPDSWKHEMERIGLELKRKMNERNITQRTVFRRLRAFSFPVRERMKLAKENRL